MAPDAFFGRVYMTLDLKNNTTRWTESFVKERRGKPGAQPLLSWLIGNARALDPGELVVREEGTRIEEPPGSSSGAVIEVKAAMFQGKVVRAQTRALPAAPAAVSAGARPPRAETGH